MKFNIYFSIFFSLWCGFCYGQLGMTEGDYYNMVTLPVPEGVVLEVGGLATLPNGDLGVSTRRGEVYIVENPTGNQPYFRLFADGMHEILGLAVRDGDFYLAQRGELTRLHDKNGDGRADRYEAVCVLPVSGHYHEYSYGPIIMDDGSMFVTGNVAFGDQEWWRGESRVPWRGWTVKISPEGELQPWATGMRSPCGIGQVDGEFFYADNQGDWMGSGGITHVEKGDFTGHPAGLRWSGEPNSPVSLTTEQLYASVDPKLSPVGGPPTKPEFDEQEETVTLFEVKEKFPSVKLPSVWLPHSVLGISTSEIVVDQTDGKFGPFSGQIFVGDQGQSKIDRLFLEKVNGVYQGAAFAFREGFQSGVLRMAWGNDGSMFVGQTNRGWGSTGPKAYGLQRLVWNGKTPFEMKAIRAMPDGFEIEFTQPVDKQTAANPDHYQITSFIYNYHPVYGSPVIRDSLHWIEGIRVSRDGLKARIVIDNPRQYFIHEITANGVKSYFDKSSLLHPTGYYTLNEIPEGEKLNLPKRPRPKKTVAMDHVHHQPAKGGPVETPDAKGGSLVAKPKATSRSSKTKTRIAKRQLRMPAHWDKPDQSILLGTRPGLKFNRTTITVKAGAKIKWTFSNNDDMPHNCVITKPGKADQVGNAAIALGVKGMNLNYVPQSSDLLYHTNLMSPGKSESIYFEAPAQAGDYIFVCTVPGHHTLMKGILKVVQ
ncbi:MAG: plastocyanin/azurin family copper-binding protein [Bacteroidota bacterium]